MKKILFITLIISFCLSICSCSKDKMSTLRDEGIQLIEEEQYDAAIEKLNEALKLGDGEIGPFQYDTILYKAECEFKLGHYTKAKELYEVLLTIDKKNKDYKTMYDTAVIYEKLVKARDALNRNDLNEAEQLLNEVRNAGYENDKSYLFNEIILAEKRGLYEDAFALLNRYLKSYPNDEEALKELDFVNVRLIPVKEPETTAPKESETSKNSKDGKSTDKNNKTNNKNSKTDKNTKSNKNQTKETTSSSKKKTN